MRAHRRALMLGVFTLGLVAALAAVAVSIATGRSGHDAAVFSRAAKLTTSVRKTGPGLSLDGTNLVAARADGRHTLGTLGDGDEVIAPLTGALTPVAVASRDGRYVVYSSWRQLARVKPGARGQGLAVGQPVGIPSIRVFDLASGKDTLLENGAASPALSTTGAIAYLAGESQAVQQNSEYAGRIVVADSVDAKPRVWTSSPARYLPYAWAGSTLLAYRGVSDSEGTDLYAYNGPDEGRLLAPDAFVIAISPDGRKVLAAVGMRTLEVIRVADGAIEDSLSLDGAAEGRGPPLPHTLMYSGSWHDERVVANSDRGLVVLNLRGGLHVESVFATPEFPHGINEPVLEDDTHVRGWADLAEPQVSASGIEEPAYDNAIVDCDLAAATCAVDHPNPARTWARWVTNPSR
jgi:hypothetical protein